MFLHIPSFNNSYLFSISIHRDLRVFTTFLVSVIIDSSEPGSLARKCLSILLNSVNSTFFGSTRINLTSAGCFLYKIDVIIALIPTDFPCPVAPATSKCGILVKSTTNVSLLIVFPKLSGSSISAS